MTLRGKVCVVTGAAKGIGRALLEEFSAAGALVIGTYHSSKASAENLCMDHKCEMHQVDLGNLAEIKAFASTVGSRHAKVDVLVNNAGVCLREQWPKVSRGIVTETMRTNFEGPLFLISQMHSLLSRASIVNVGSVQAHIATAQPHYTASKAALHSLTVYLAKQMAPYARVNTVAPGYVDTDMTAGVDKEHLLSQGSIPLKRFGSPREIAKAVRFLADEELSGYVTGETLNVNGGMYMA